MSTLKLTLRVRATDYQRLNDPELDAEFSEGAPQAVRDKRAELLKAFLKEAEKKAVLSNGKGAKKAKEKAAGQDEVRSRLKCELGRGSILVCAPRQGQAKLMEDLSGPCFGGAAGAFSGTGVFRAEDLELKDWDRVEIHFQIQIKSRLDSKDHAYFLATLLTCGDISADSESVFESSDGLFDFLLLDQLASAVRAAAPKGYFRRYQRFERNDSRLRGSIDVGRHIRCNAMLQNGAIAYSYRENSVDNSLNRLLLCAYERLGEKYPGLAELKLRRDMQLSEYFRGLYQLIGGRKWNVQQLLLENQRPVAHPYFTEYEHIRSICMKILRDEKTSVFDGSSGEVNGFLYYLPDLWEDYLEKLMCRALEDPELKALGPVLCSQADNKENNATMTSYVAGEAKPDYLLLADRSGKVPRFYKKADKEEYLSGTALILDAKFKPGYKDCLRWSGEKKLTYTRAKEDVDKAIRDTAAKAAAGFGLIFPIESAEKDTRLFSAPLSHQNPALRCYALVYAVPPSAEKGIGFAQWQGALADEDARFRSAFCEMAVEACRSKMEKRDTETVSKLEKRLPDPYKAEFRRRLKALIAEYQRRLPPEK